MRWMLSEAGKILRTLFLVLLLLATALIGLLLGADVYLTARFNASALVRDLDYANRKNVDATALLKRALAQADLSEYRVETVLQEQHGFRCQPVNGISRCLYIKKGLLNCAHSIGIDLRFDDAKTLTSAIADSYVGCDG